MIIICLNFTSVVVVVVIMLTEWLIPRAMQEAAAVWLVRPFCCSPLPNQRDISGRCVHHRQRGPTVSDEGSAQSLVHQNATHCMKQDVNNQSRIPPRLSSFSSLVFSALVSFIYCLMSEIRSVFNFIFEFPLARWFWPLMDLRRQRKRNHLLSMMRRCWNWQNSWCDGTVFTTWLLFPDTLLFFGCDLKRLFDSTVFSHKHFTTLQSYNYESPLVRRLTFLQTTDKSYVPYWHFYKMCHTTFTNVWQCLRTVFYMWRWRVIRQWRHIRQGHSSSLCFNISRRHTTGYF